MLCSRCKKRQAVVFISTIQGNDKRDEGLCLICAKELGVPQVNDYLEMCIRDREINVLNMFAYTGGATLACAKAGAKVCHLDAVKGMVDWGRTNAKLSGLSDKPISVYKRQAFREILLFSP